MMTFLLIMIYLAFISLGLPDSLLGAAWPSMRLTLNAPLSAAGPLSMIVSCGTVVSSLLSGRVIAARTKLVKNRLALLAGFERRHNSNSVRVYK